MKTLKEFELIFGEQPTETSHPFYKRRWSLTYRLWKRNDQEALCKLILACIDRSGIEGIYNWGSPLRDIRKIIESFK